ncbi:MAG: protein kinase domain-containing protein [Phycisphaerales bacterium]
MHPTTIGPFRIERELGRGGMGEVYLARDSRLDRQVAIKAIPEHMVADADRLARFQREAKVLASLNHPNIGAIYGLEESAGGADGAGGGRQYLILEYIEGETLAQRLAGGPIPIDESLAIARQIAEALEAAHDKGIVHRDLKPGNVMVTDAGVAKVLDFGLARAAEGAASSSAHMSASLADSPTITTPAARAQPVHSPTIPGVIMGSAGYMSPEQARGKAVDKRSDIFSFGCVLYEMLTGVRAFAGETVTDYLGAILHREPEWSRLPAATPPIIRQLLKRCLAKDRHHRLRDMGDARMEIEQAIADPRGTTSGIQTPTPAPARSWWQSPAALIAAALLALAAAIAFMALRPSAATSRAQPTIVRAALTLPKGLVLMQGDRAIAVSPEGTRVVVAAFQPGVVGSLALYLRDLSRLDFRKLEGTEGATYPFWSPDGTSIAFFSVDKLKRIDLADNIVRIICDAPTGRGGSWGSKGTIVFAPSAGGGLKLVNASGGTPTPATTSSGPAESHRNPCFLPDGERFLYAAANVEKEGVYAFDPATKQSTFLLPGRVEAFFVEPGSLVFARDENLMAQRFDPARLQLTGVATPIAADVGYALTRAYINAGFSSNGTMVYQPVARRPRSKLAWMDLKGQRTHLPVEPVAIANASLSADARRAAVQFQGDRGDSKVAVVDLDRGITTTITDPKITFAYRPQLTADGQRVINSIVTGGKQNIVSYPAGGGAPTILMEGDGSEYEMSSITPDGKAMLFTSVPGFDKSGDIMTMDLTAPNSVKPFLQTPVPEWLPVVSPAGDAVIFIVSREQSPGASVIGVLKAATFPTPGTPVQVSSAIVGGLICWTGPKQVCWVDTQRRVWSADIAVNGSQIDIGPQTPMFEGKPLDEQVRLLEFDITKQSFLIAVDDEPREEPRLIVVSDWRPAAAAPARE